ncbi:MAG: Uma2 family endonuclease [Spirulinaceae cyanobacterium]
MTFAIAETISEQPILFDKMTWQEFKTVQSILERPGVRLSFLKGILELRLMPGRKHEVIKQRISSLLDIYLEIANINYTPTGSMTLESETGLVKREADLSYELNEGREYPDLVVEVVVTSGGIDKLEAYKRLNIPEVWFWEAGSLSIYALEKVEAKIGYRRLETSKCLPRLDINLFKKYVELPNHLQAVREFRQALSIDN